MKQTKADKILDATKEERLRYKLIDGQYRLRRKPDRLLFTREELIAFLVNNNIHTLQQLRKQRRPKIDPYDWNYRKTFGSWGVALQEAWGDSVKLYRPCTNARYIIDLMREYKITTLKQFDKLHKLHPDVFPCADSVRQNFGGIKFARYVIQIYSLRAMVGEYLKLKKKLKKTPLWEECKEAGIDPALILNHFKKKATFDDLVRELDNPLLTLETAQTNEKRRRTKS